MKDEILKLVFDYSRNGRLADKAFIKKIVELTVDENHLENYVTDTKFRPLKPSVNGATLAAYDYIRLRILVDMKNVSEMIEEYFSEFDGTFNALEPYFYRNFGIVQFIRHELEHAMQLKQSFLSKETDLETTLLNVCLEDVVSLHDPKVHELIANGDLSFRDLICYSDSKRSLQKQFYMQDPTERLAQINSYGTVIEYLKEIKNYVPNVLHVEQEMLLMEMIRGYSYHEFQLTAPTPKFLENVGEETFWKSLDFYDEDSETLQRNVEKQYSLKKRLTLGLPIRNHEYERVRRSITIY